MLSLDHHPSKSLPRRLWDDIFSGRRLDGLPHSRPTPAKHRRKNETILIMKYDEDINLVIDCKHTSRCTKYTWNTERRTINSGHQKNRVVVTCYWSNHSVSRSPNIELHSHVSSNTHKLLAVESSTGRHSNIQCEYIWICKYASFYQSNMAQVAR